MTFSWKETFRELVKTTLIGGASFLLPVAIIIFVLSYALRLIRRIAEPISHSLHLDHLVGAGVGTVTILSVAVLVLISFGGGIVARTAAGRRITRWSESSFLGRFPHYQVIKAMAEGLAHIENTSGLRPALINIENGWQIGYLVEQLNKDWGVFAASALAHVRQRDVHAGRPGAAT
jgi:uncharacterized membrane protein